MCTGMCCRQEDVEEAPHEGITQRFLPQGAGARASKGELATEAAEVWLEVHASECYLPASSFTLDLHACGIILFGLYKSSHRFVILAEVVWAGTVSVIILQQALLKVVHPIYDSGLA
jgi:hypothetical protein